MNRLIGLLSLLLVGSAYTAEAISSNYTFQQQQRLQASSPTLNNFFGWSMSMDKTALYLAVGSPLTSWGGSATFRGAAHVFQRTPAGAVTTSAFTWSAAGTNNTLYNQIDAQNFDFFGQEVFVATDGVNVMVAVYALRGLSTLLREGGVYLFNRQHSDTPSTNSWTTNTGYALVGASAGVNGKLTPRDALKPYRFGEALTGDLQRTGSRVPMLVVGEFRFNQKRGRVHLYQYTASAWNFNNTLLAPNNTAGTTADYGAANSGFGISLSLNNDFLAIGASGTELNRGVVHIYQDVATAPSSAFKYLRTVRSLDGVVGDQYGWAVALSDDWLAIGANRREDCGVACGALYANFRNTGASPELTQTNGWGQKVKVTVPAAQAGSQLGSSVAITGDFIVAGAPDASIDNVTASTGVVYVFQKNTGNNGFFAADNWGFVGRFGKSSPVARDRLGRKVATYAPHVLAASMLDDTTATNAGAVYYFTGNLPLGGSSGNPPVDPNVTLSTTGVAVASTTGGGSGAVVTASPAPELGGLLLDCLY